LSRGLKGPVVGLGTIKILEESGMTTLQEIAQMTLVDFESLGIKPHFAKQIMDYLHRSARQLGSPIVSAI
jgi:hypothetical protein